MNNQNIPFDRNQNNSDSNDRSLGNEGGGLQNHKKIDKSTNVNTQIKPENDLEKFKQKISPDFKNDINGNQGNNAQGGTNQNQNFNQNIPSDNMNMENNSDMNKMIDQNNNINNNNECNIQESISPFSNEMNNDLLMIGMNNINAMGMNPNNISNPMNIGETSDQEKGNNMGMNPINMTNPMNIEETPDQEMGNADSSLKNMGNNNPSNFSTYLPLKFLVILINRLKLKKRKEGIME
jgi:hypothetical protein